MCWCLVNGAPKGIYPPDVFIPLAGKVELFLNLTKWVLIEAFKTYKDWRNKGIDVIMSINLSALDLEQYSLPSFVSEQLRVFDVPPDRITFEVTESAVMNEPEMAIKSLSHLKQMGIKLSIDDFGTGYSSLAQLKKLPVTELKIDKSFISELATNPDDAAIVKATVDLAHNLNMTVVAEGIEDRITLDVLHGLGVEIGQGYYISNSSNDSFVEWIKSCEVASLFNDEAS